MVTLKVVVVAHCPASGVKVYTVVPGVAVLKAGDHTPVMLLLEVVGSAVGVAASLHSGPTGSKVGVI